MRKNLVLVSVVLTLLLTSAIPAVAQAPRGEGTCVFSAEEGGYLCTFRPFQDIDARCPAEETAERGDTLGCTSLETGESFTCTVVEVLVDLPLPGGNLILISCEPLEEEPVPEPAPEPAPEPLEITQEGEQEAESGEIDQSFEVS